MGLRYLSSDSAGMKHNLKRSLQQGREVIQELNNGSDRLVNAVDGHTLSGAAYTAGQELFRDLIIPTITRVSNALDNVESDLRQYESQEHIVSSEAILDEDTLMQERQIKRSLADSAHSMSNMYADFAKSIEHLPVLDMGAGMFKSHAKQMQNVAESYQDEVKKIEKKLKKLHQFSDATRGLFEHSLKELASAMHAVTTLNSVVVNSGTGTYSIPKKRESYSFDFKNGALDTSGKRGKYNANAQLFIADFSNKFGFGKKFVGIKSENSTTLGSVSAGYASSKNRIYAKFLADVQSVVINLDAYSNDEEIKYGLNAKVIGYAGKLRFGGDINKYWGIGFEFLAGEQASIGETYTLIKGDSINKYFNLYTAEKSYEISDILGIKTKVKYPVIVWK
ncbi:hypothetical protein WOSG25_070060 [Weissella oryzae SG25]|uniref:LXG domain-containing protein n=1 Tax=Weissella oryzae (strain DSM 25784 / JCM 18191 / LMG 30913 / SG25) TaxID=1329250 RepID=A0A069CU47_WEIOS|nr:T7SS effector LXG polymorphic toxin [Weissella oryzae]GAK31029.1 hypothetical protein WOSG25_070060 [Weissella oryzae SG25]